MLVESIRRTFARRGTPIPEQAPVGLTSDFWLLSGRDAQVRAFARRAKLKQIPEDAPDIGQRVAAFALPLLEAARALSKEGISNWRTRSTDRWWLDSYAMEIA
jgi:hypothetical protein